MSEVQHAAARRLCSSAELHDGGTGVRFEVVRDGVTENAFVIRHRGQVHAYINRCGHVPVELDWQEGEFFDHEQRYLICAVHGAIYSPEDGHCVGGRCNGRGLVTVAVFERDGNVYSKE